MEWHDEIASTHDECVRRVKCGEAREGLVIAADRQSAAHGRLGRAWQSPPKVGLYVSMVLKPRDSEKLTQKQDLPKRVIYPASSILEETGVAIDRMGLLEQWLNRMESLRGRDIAALWMEHDALKGKPVCVTLPTGEVTGIGDGIDPDGALLLKQQDGSSIQVVAGDVRKDEHFQNFRAPVDRERENGV